MYTPFSRTLRALNADGGLGPPIFVATGVLLALWGAWFVGARVTVYETTPSARLEVDETARAVIAGASGDVVSVNAALDQSVAADDVLFELDAEPLRIDEDQAMATRATLARRLESGRVALAAEEAALESAAVATDAAISQARSEADRAERVAQQSKLEAARAARLLAAGNISASEAEHLMGGAEQDADSASAARANASRVTAEARRDDGDRRAAIELLRRELDSLDASLAESDALLARLAYDQNRALVRAPVDGRVIELAALRPGDRVNVGTRLGSVLPDGHMCVVANFPPHQALGRIEPGQTAQLRMDGFPWTSYGTLAARVSAVAGEPRYGQIRVDLELLADPTSTDIPLQHGLIGTLEVAVEQVSPAELVLRAVGRHLEGR